MNLKELREQKKLKQKEIAEILHIAPSTYGGYELETSEPNINTLIQLADYYDVSLDYLVGREYYNGIGYLSDQQRLAVNKIKQLNDMNLAKAIAYISGMQTAQ